MKTLRAQITRRRLNLIALPMVLVALILWVGVGSGKTFAYNDVQNCLGSGGAFSISDNNFQSINKAGFQTIEVASSDPQGRQITASVVVAGSIGEAKHIVDIANSGLAYGDGPQRTRRFHNVVVSFDRNAPANLWAPVENCLHG